MAAMKMQEQGSGIIVPQRPALPKGYVRYLLDSDSASLVNACKRVFSKSGATQVATASSRML
jgi:hypothetical protein